MRRDCPNAKKILLTHDGYISASDDEEVTDPTSEKSEEVDHLLDGYELTVNCKKNLVKRVQADIIEDKGRGGLFFRLNAKLITPVAS
jgi:hypothetical protein